MQHLYILQGAGDGKIQLLKVRINLLTEHNEALSLSGVNWGFIHFLNHSFIHYGPTGAENKASIC